MGAVISALAEWLGPFLVQIAVWALANLGRAVFVSLGIGIATFTGLDAASNALLGYFSGLGGFTGDVAAFSALLGMPQVIGIWTSAVSIKVVMVKAKAVVVAGSMV